MTTYSVPLTVTWVSWQHAPANGHALPPWTVWHGVEGDYERQYEGTRTLCGIRIPGIGEVFDRGISPSAEYPTCERCKRVLASRGVQVKNP